MNQFQAMIVRTSDPSFTPTEADAKTLFAAGESVGKTEAEVVADLRAMIEARSLIPAAGEYQQRSVDLEAARLIQGSFNAIGQHVAENVAAKEQAMVESIRAAARLQEIMAVNAELFAFE